MADVIKVACFNCNGLNFRSDEIDRYIVDGDFDIVLFSETHLAPGLHYRGKPRGFSFYRVDHPSCNCRGGVGLLIKSNIPHFYDPNLNVSTECIQAVGVSIKTNLGEIFVGAVYCPPNARGFDKQTFLDFFDSIPKRFILGGDWNSKHTNFGCRVNNPRGRHLLPVLQEINGAPITDGFPTYYPSDPDKIPDILDFFIIKNVSRNYLAVGSDLDMTSDHIPIKLALHNSIILRKCNHVTNSGTDWDRFRSILNSQISRLRIDSIMILETEAENLAGLIISAAQKATPVRKYNKSNLTLPRELRDLIQERRRARAKWNKSRFYRDRQYFNKVNRITTNKISEFRENKTRDFLQSLTPTFQTDYSLWKVTKYLKKEERFKQPLQRPDGTWTRSYQEAADEFRRHLADVFQPHQTVHSDLDLGTEMTKLTPNPIDEFAKISHHEVADMIKFKIKTKKAPGMDLITGELLKQLPNLALKKLADIFNAALELRHVPSAWKKAEVILIPKSGKPPALASSYRPISLLSIVGKLFERLFLKRLQPIIDERKIFPPHQFGFRRGHSTIEQVHRIVNLVERAMEHKLVCSAAFLDIAQAFDRVWIEGLLFKILKLLPINYYEILVSYLSDRSFRVRHGDAVSEFSEISASVPQGSVCGPILFLIYLSDFPKMSRVKKAKFADDTALASIGHDPRQAKEDLQGGLDETSGYCKRWRILLNCQKSQHVTFTNRRTHPAPVYLDGNVIPQTKTANYLGMLLDSKLTYGPHIQRKRRQVLDKFKRMWWLFRPGSGVSLANKILLYKMIIKPVWTYGCQLWGCASPTLINRIQTAENYILRGLSGVKWDDYIMNDVIHHILGVPTVQDTITQLSLGYAERLSRHPNDKAFSLFSHYNDGLRRLKRRKPLDNVADCLTNLM